jgi:hypothetical protein
MHWNRRSFLGLSAATGLIKVLPAAAQARPSGKQEGNVVSALDFGADPTGTKDSTAAMRKAISKLAAEGAVLDLPKGTYRFDASKETAMSLKGLRNVEIRGNGSSLLFAGGTQPFNVDDCAGFRVKDVVIDWPRPPYSQGTVRRTGPKWFEIDIDPEFPVNGSEEVQAISDYDRRTKMPMVNGIDSYHCVSSLRLAAPQCLHVELKAPLPVHEGSVLVLRHNIYGVDGFRINRCSQVEFQDVTMYAMPGMGLLLVNSEGLSLNGLHTVIKPGTNRLMSLCADSVHLTDCSGRVEITNCSFQGMGDDAINICASYFKVSSRFDSHTLGLDKGGRSDLPTWRLPQPQTSVQIIDAGTQQVLALATVASVTSDAHGTLMSFTSDLPAGIGTGAIVCGSQDATHTTIRHSKFGPNRARGILLHKNAEISDNSFSGCSLAAILMAADSFWLEGPTVSDVNITRNTFDNCYYAHANDRRGTITLDTAHDRPAPKTPPVRVNQNVSITQNTFLTSPGAAIYCAGVGGLQIRQNHLGHADTLATGTAPADAIVLRNTSQTAIEGNQSPVTANIEALDCVMPIHQNHNQRLTLVTTTAKDTNPSSIQAGQ